MTSTLAEHSKTANYKVVVVEQIETPTGMSGAWYRYVIQRGESKIEGQQSGELDHVIEHAENFAESLNERLSRKVHAYGSRPKK